MTKEEKIKEAYGYYWEQVKDYVDENGWCSEPTTFKIATLFFCMNYECITHGNVKNNYMKYWRPKSLQGIENNNGWIKIESEKDLPKENNLDCYVFRNGEVEMATFDNETKKFYDFETSYDRRLKYVTHYQPIVKPLNPIY